MEMTFRLTLYPLLDEFINVVRSDVRTAQQRQCLLARMNAQGLTSRQSLQSLLERKPAGMLRSCVQFAARDLGRRAYRTHGLRSPAVAFADGWVESQLISNGSGSVAARFRFHTRSQRVERGV